MRIEPVIEAARGNVRVRPLLITSYDLPMFKSM